MAYRKCKIYFDGSHHIAIPPQPRKPRPKKGAKVKKEVPDMEELDAEDENCPFDNLVQLSLFDGEKREEDLPEPPQENSNNQNPTQTCNENAAAPSRIEIFEKLYKEHLYDSKRKRKYKIIKGMLPYCKDYERIVYYGDLPQYFVSDVMEDDILCPYGEDGRKFILADSFGCWDEGEYMGQVRKETIAKMPKAN